jgi:ABC-2 type transport system permease protein
MSARINALRAGLDRGWTEFRSSIKSPQDQGFYVFTALITLRYLFVRRNTDVPGTNLAFVTIALPSILGALVVFNLVIGPAYTIAMEKETARCSVFEPLPTA